MNNIEFSKFLKNAIKGKAEAINKILLEYDGIIKKYSKINGIIDEDCVSNLRYDLIKSLKRFKNLWNCYKIVTKSSN